jgi:hypothetical protein
MKRRDAVLRAAIASAVALLAAALTMLAAGAAAAGTIHLYSYDPSDEATRKAAGPLTFTFDKGLFHITMLNVRSTEAEATAYLHRADERVLGVGGLVRVTGSSPQARDLYEIDHGAEGGALIGAFCPGAARAWMAFGPVHLDRDLTVLVIGAAAGHPAKLCRTLNFDFHGEWTPPPGRPIDPRDLERRQFPG